MRAVVQRALSARVEVGGEVVGAIERGLVVFVGAAKDDAEADVEYMANKVAGLRVFPDEAGKSARTRWRKLAERDGQSLVEFQPLTGRTHQIRIHAARGLGAAIVGDPVYGARSEAMLLHSWRIVVPRDRKPPIDVTAPVPDSFGLWLDFLDA